MSKVVVITGSTRGIGLGMAREFLERGACVVVSGRSESSVSRALQVIGGDADRLAGQVCDVSSAEQVDALWDAAVARFGRVDIWINNAGINNTRLKFVELPVEECQQVVATNLLGTMYGSRTALLGMQAQGSGALYNFEGFGSDGIKAPGLSVYGASKCAIRYFTASLLKEYRDGPVLIGYLSPGIVVTDMILAEGRQNAPTWQRTRRIYDILADRVETVAPWLVEQILANRSQGKRITWLTTRKAIGRFLSSRVRRRKVLADADLNAV